jgi:hypothetical protein
VLPKIRDFAFKIDVFISIFITVASVPRRQSGLIRGSILLDVIESWDKKHCSHFRHWPSVVPKLGAKIGSNDAQDAVDMNIAVDEEIDSRTLWLNDHFAPSAVILMLSFRSHAFAINVITLDSLEDSACAKWLQC